MNIVRKIEIAIIAGILGCGSCGCHARGATTPVSVARPAEPTADEVIALLLRQHTCPLYRDASEDEARRLLTTYPSRYVPRILAMININDVPNARDDSMGRRLQALSLVVQFGTPMQRTEVRRLFSQAHVRRSKLEAERERITNAADPTVAQRRALLNRIVVLLNFEYGAIIAFTVVRDPSLRDELLAIYDSDIQLRGAIWNYFDAAYPKDQAIRDHLVAHSTTVKHASDQ
jgi:hypothetical protein